MKNKKEIILGFLAEIFEFQKFSEEDKKKILENKEQLKNDFSLSLQKIVMSGQKIGPPIKNFSIIIPSDYNHETEISNFIKSFGKNKTTQFCCFDLSLKNFKKTTKKLEPGKRYQVKFFPVVGSVSTEECLSFMEKQGAIFVGAQGLTLLQRIKSEEFPIGKRVISLDKKESLEINNQGLSVFPEIRRLNGGDWWLSSCLYEENNINKDFVLVCFFE